MSVRPPIAYLMSDFKDEKEAKKFIRYMHRRGKRDGFELIYKRKGNLVIWINAPVNWAELLPELLAEKNRQINRFSGVVA